MRHTRLQSHTPNQITPNSTLLTTVYARCGFILNDRFETSELLNGTLKLLTTLDARVSIFFASMGDEAFVFGDFVGDGTGAGVLSGEG